MYNEICSGENEHLYILYAEIARFCGKAIILTPIIHNIEYRVPYREAVKRYAQFRPLPSGIGHFHHRLYLELARMLETQHQTSYWVLDLGTFFGHSAFTLLQGAALASAHPNLHVLSIDLFQ